MTTKRYPIYIDIINFILIMILICSLDLLICTGMAFPFTAYEGLSFAAVIIWSYIIRKTVKWLWLYIPANVLMFGLCMISTAYDIARVKVGIVTLVMVLLNINFWINERDGSFDIPYPAVVIVAVGYIYCKDRNGGQYEMLLYGMAVVFVLLEMIKALLSNYREIAMSGQLTDDMPVREIFRNNSIGAIAVMATVIISMILVKADGLIALIKRLWFAFASTLGRLINIEVPEVEKANEELPIYDVKPPVTEKEWGIIEEILHYIELALYVVTVCVLIYVLIRALIWFVKLLFKKRDIKTESRTFATKNEVRERLSREDYDTESRFGLFKSPTEKVRYLYRKKLLALKKSGSSISDTMTPRENRDSAMKDKHDIKAATSFYERVRYSPNHEVSKEEVSAFKNMIK